MTPTTAHAPPSSGTEPRASRPGDRSTAAAPAVVVGVDDSTRNRGAVAWAVAHVSATQRPLVLVHVLEKHPFARPGARPDGEARHSWRQLDETVRSLRLLHPRLLVRETVASGRAETQLARLATGQALLVVGRQSRNGSVHPMVGTTALGLAGRATVPVVVVPDDWNPDRHSSDPVVLGIDPVDHQPAAVRFAFDEALRRGVPLLAAHGGGVPGRDWRSAHATRDGEKAERNSEDALARAIAPYCLEHPQVAVRLAHRMAHPLTVLLEDAAPSQLVVLGRHTSVGSPGFPIGSVARGVLTYAGVPVAVVPPGA